MKVVYKSKYSIVCDLVGHPKPTTQEEEDWCYWLEKEPFLDTATVSITGMLKRYLERINHNSEVIIKERKKKKRNIIQWLLN